MTKETFANLLSKEIGGSISEKESTELQQTLTDNPRLKTVYDEIGQFINDRATENEIDIEAKLNDVWGKIERHPARNLGQCPPKSSSKRQVLLFWSRIAAAVILIAGLSWVAYQSFSSKQQLYSEKIAAADEALYAVLDDGSQVWLAPHSEISYNKQFGHESRHMRLTGKAFFDVAHNPDLPFTVTAHDVEVAVKGTAFNVDALSSSVEVVLLRGLVAVKDNREQDAEEILLHPNQKITLRKGETATSDSIHALRHPEQAKDSVVVAQAETKWTQGTLVFQKQRLADLSKLMEKRFGVIIRINNEKLAEQRFTGIISDESLKQMLDALRQSYPFKYQIKGKQVLIN